MDALGFREESAQSDRSESVMSVGPHPTTMIEGTDEAVASADDAAERRDEVVAAVADHAGRIARELAMLKGGDYGQETFGTDAGEWTVKYEAGAIQYLRFDGRSGGEIYVISEHRPPAPEDLATAMADYDAFVASFNEYVESLSGVLDGVDADFSEAASTETVVAERDRIVDRIRDVADAMAGELHRCEGTDYGEFSTRAAGKRWTLKRDGARASYLRVGGEGGIYLLSQYGPPSARDLRTHVDGVREFVAAFNEHVAELESDLSTVSF
jgi:hypothetical protein